MLLASVELVEVASCVLDAIEVDAEIELVSAQIELVDGSELVSLVELITAVEVVGSTLVLEGDVDVDVRSENILMWPVNGAAPSIVKPVVSVLVEVSMDVEVGEAELVSGVVVVSKVVVVVGSVDVVLLSLNFALISSQRSADSHVLVVVASVVVVSVVVGSIVVSVVVLTVVVVKSISITHSEGAAVGVSLPVRTHGRLGS